MEVKIGKEVEYRRVFSAQEVATFATVSEDNNPIHLDEAYAAASIFGKRVVHGILLTSMFSKIFGTIYPGNGGIYLAQNSKFLKPIFVDEEVVSKVTLIEYDEATRKSLFKTECFNHAGKLAVVGEAKILFPEMN